MIRKIFCYGSFLIELILLGYVSYCFLYEENMNFTLFVISIIMLILNIPALIISILLFGAPSNTYSEYIIRHISYNDILKENHLITIRIRGNGFLYNMVRIIAGTLIKIGMHEMSDTCVPSILEAENREAAGPTAPAQGLMLVGIEYPHLQ